MQDKSLLCHRPITKRSAYSVDGAGKAFKVQRLPSLKPVCVQGRGKAPQPGLEHKRQRARNKNPACSGAPCLQNGTHASLPFAQTLKQPETHPSRKTGIRYSKYTLITRCAPGEQGDTVPPRARPSECALIGADGSAVLYHNKARRVCEGKVGSLWGGCTGPRRLGMKVH